jgi:hypothetical protein
VIPDLSAADAWLTARPVIERKRRGQWVTPWWLVEQAVDRLAPDLPPRPHVADLACGDGRWLVAVGRRFAGARLTGVDADPLAVEAARTTLRKAGLHAEITLGDGLADDVAGPCDAVVGNPPWIRPQHLDREVARRWWARFSVATDKVDTSVLFTQRALELAPRAVLVLPANLLSLTSCAATRAWLLRSGVDGVFELPPTAFDATVHGVVVFAGPTDRRIAGSATEEDGLTVTGTLSVSPEAWSVRGPIPTLPGRPLGTHVRVSMGIVCGDYARYVHAGRERPEDRPTCRGRDVSRWEIAPTSEHVWYVPDEMLARKPYVAPKHAGLFDVPRKIVLAGTTGTTLRAALDEEQRFPLDSCYVVHPRRPETDPWAVLGLLLSRPVGDWYAARFRAVRVKGVEVVRIPVPDQGWDAIALAARDRDEPALDRAVCDAYGATR